MLKGLSLKGLIPIVFCGLSLGFLTECPPGPSTEDIVNNSIHELDKAQSDWQKVLTDTRDQLTDSAQSTIRNEVSQTLNRAIGAAGATGMCGADFIRDRVREDLAAILAKIRNQPAPPRKPAICTVNPGSIDIKLVPARVQFVEYFGYNLDSNKIRAFLEEGSTLVNVTQFLDRPTHFHITLKFGVGGVQLSAQSKRIILRYNSNDLSTVGIVQQPLSVDYQIQIRTWDFASGTASSSGRVSVKFSGKLAQSGVIVVPGAFVRGTIESKIFTSQADLGEITSVYVLYDEGGDHNGWALDWIELKVLKNGAPNTGKTYHFAGNRWLGNQEPCEIVLANPSVQ